LLFTKTLPEALPVAVGANTTAKDVAWPGERTRGNARPDALKPVPLTLYEESETLVFPLLVSVTVCVALVPVVTLPKLKAAGDALSCCVAETALPERRTETDGVAELFRKLRLPEYVPAAAGEKLTVHWYEPPGGMV